MSRLADDDLWAAGGVLLLAGLAVWKRDELGVAAEQAAGAVTDLLERGARLNHSLVDDAGVVQSDPDELVAEAAAIMGEDVTRDDYALARMGRSEGQDGEAYRMHVAINDLADLQATYGMGVYSSLWELMLHSKNARANGKFSEQYLGKRYSTSKDPYAGDVRLARQVRAAHAAGADPTGGADKFLDKDSFSSQPGATSTYEAKRAEWEAAGYEAVEDLPGASSNFVVFRKTA